MKLISASQSAATCGMSANGEVRVGILDKPDSEGNVYGFVWLVLDEVIVPKSMYGNIMKGLKRGHAFEVWSYYSSKLPLVTLAR